MVMIGVLPEDVHIDDGLSHGSDLSVAPAKLLAGLIRHDVVHAAQEVSQLQLGFPQDTKRGHPDILFEISARHSHRSSTWHQLSFTKTKVDGKGLVVNVDSKVGLCLACKRLNAHLLKHLMHVLV